MNSRTVLAAVALSVLAFASAIPAFGSIGIGHPRYDAYDSAILAATKKYNFPSPLLIKAATIVASGYKTDATSSNTPCGVPAGWTVAESHSFGLLQSTPACNATFLLPSGHPNLETNSAAQAWQTSIFNPDYHIDVNVKHLVQRYYEPYKIKFSCTSGEYVKMAIAGWSGGFYSVKGCTSYPTTYLNAVLVWHDKISDIVSGDETDKFGIAKIYPTAGAEWYVNMQDPDSDTRFRNLPSMTKQPDGSWQVSAPQVRMEAWSAVDKWLNVEITGYVKMQSGTGLVQLYSRGGHHFADESKSCEGSAVKARFWSNGNVAWVKEVNHPAYTSNRALTDATDSQIFEKWYGVKAVIYNIVENGKTYVKMESYIDDDVTDSSGNLAIANDWQLATTYVDRGGWETTNSDFKSTCPPLDRDSDNQYRQRDEILSLPGGPSTGNLVAWRSDGLTWSWKYLSVREIQPPSTAPVESTNLSGLHGVNYMDPVLDRKQSQKAMSANRAQVERNVDLAAEYGFKILRVPVTWEAYVGNEDNMLQQIKYIAEEAGEHDIKIFFDNHHFYTSSQWGCDVYHKGRGFPSLVTLNYAPQGDGDCTTQSYQTDTEIQAFWSDWYTNNIRGVDDAWELQADYLKDVVRAVDNYPNVVGYELMNEPHIWQVEQYKQLGQYHTRLATELREVTDKTLIFTREVTRGGLERQPSQEVHILPLDPIKNVQYWPHMYAPMSWSSGKAQIDRFLGYQQQWKDMGYNVDIGIGEWAVQDNQIPDLATFSEEEGQELMDGFVRTWSELGWPATYWSFGGFAQEEGNVLMYKDGSLTRYGKWYTHAIDKFYN